MRPYEVKLFVEANTKFPAINIEFCVDAESLEMAILAAEEIQLTLGKHKFDMYSVVEVIEDEA